MELDSIKYKGICYPIATIPNDFSGRKGYVTIGSEFLNKALFDEKKGYPDEEAIRIDEGIYAYMDDEYFTLSEKSFIEKAKRLLD